MLVDRPAGLEVKSNLQGTRHAMGFDESALIHIMSVLTNLYSDPERAVVREYTTNARDSHVAAGNTDPIEVFTPTPLSPMFRVVDHGLGMSGDDIRDIYSKYGASTKRDSNDFNGQLGLGCKAALAYAEQFTLVGIKDGVRTQVSVSRDESGAGSMTVVSETPTDEPNGVEISVPTKRHNAFTQKAGDMFRYWPKGSVLLNGQEPQHIEGLKLSDALILEEATGGSNPTPVIVMGGVAYPCNELDRLGYTSYKYRLVAFVDIGEVNFTPSREELRSTPKTKATIERLMKEYRSAAMNAAQLDLNKAKTKPEALRASLKWSEALGQRNVATMTWRGVSIPDTIDRGAGYGTHGLTRVAELNSHRALASVPHNFYASLLVDALYIYDFKLDKFTWQHRKKAQQWLTENNLSAQRLILAPSKDTRYTQWIEPERVVDWSVIRAVKLPRSPTASTGRPTGAYDAIYASATSGHSYFHATSADALDTKHPIYYHIGDRYTAHRFYDFLAKGGTDKVFTFLYMPHTRQAKFERNFPKAINVADWLKQRADAFVAKLTDEDKLAMAVRNSRLSEWGALDLRRVADPELHKIVKALKHDVSAKATNLQTLELLLRKRFPDAHVDPPQPDLNYPLYDEGHLRYHSDHVYLYLNAAYAAAKGASK